MMRIATRRLMRAGQTVSCTNKQEVQNRGDVYKRQDGRCVLQDGRTVIFQAKRLKNSNGKLLSRMKEEREKLDRLAQYGIRTDRYILAIADDLLPEKKSAVIKLLDPYILNPEDLITARDLNNWLSGPDSGYRAVEEKYFKLWIQNTKTLQRILFETVNSRLAEQSRICLLYTSRCV